MERTTSSGVDGRSRDAMRKKKDISRSPPLGDFPCRLAGRQTAKQRGVIMHTVVNLWGRPGLGRLRRPFPTPVFWPHLGFAFNPSLFFHFTLEYFLGSKL